MEPQAAESVLTRMLNTIPDLVFFKDTEGTYLGCNPAFADFFGVPSEQLFGKTDYDFVDTEIADSFRANDLAAMAAGGPTANEEWITYSSDGRRALVETVKTPVVEANGRIVGIVGVAREVTELRQAQDALGEREGYLRALIDNFPFLVWLKDTDSRFLTVNSAFAAACQGGAAIDVAGKTDLDVWPADLAEAYRADDRVVLDSRQPKHVEEPVVQDGERRWHETFKAPVFDDSGELLGTVGFARDISDRKLAEEALGSRDALLVGLSKVTSHLSADTELTPANVGAALRELGVVTGVDRVYVFEHTPGEGSVRGTISQRYEWSVDDVTPQIDNPDLQDVPWDEAAPRWYDTFVEGGYVAGHVRDFPASEREALEPQGIVSLLALPIEANGRLWGFIGFDSCRRERTWADAEVGLLRSTASSLSVTIERMRADASVRESERNFSDFFSAIGDIVVVGAQDGTLLHANAAFYDKLGYAEADLGSLNVLDMHPPDRRSEAEVILGDMLKGERDACPLPLATKRGRLVPVETRIWFGSWNGQRCIFGVSKDLSREQAALQRFDRLFRSNPAPMMVSDARDGMILDVNEAFVTTLGYSHEDVRGKTSAEIGLFVDQRVRDGAVAELLQHERVNDLETHVRRKDGQVLDGLFSAELIHDQDSTHILSVMTDITQLKIAQEEINSLNSMIGVVGGVSEMRDPYTAGHQRRVAELATRIADELGLPDREIADIRMAALMLDIGKVAVPAEILAKPGPLTALEFGLVKGHAAAGSSLIASAHMNGSIAEYVLQHHERCDGTGYPSGLLAHELLTGSRILMVADVLEAMTSHRPYRIAHTLEAALAELEDGSGSRYDAGVVDACLDVVRNKGFTLGDN
ncbi:MAG: PAS domain S-box protein [Coriobacteriia bacterium]|nr:PAS domain S-box protein [Coriobacteriia bacterium]